MRKPEINIYVMHSVKGGCGKSACALSKALSIANDRLHETRLIASQQRTKVLFLDADFRGSALQHLLFRNDYRNVRELPDERVEGAGQGTEHRIALYNNYDAGNNLNAYLAGNISSLEKIINHTFTYHIPGELNAEEAIKDTNVQGKVFINGYVDWILAATDSREKAWFSHGIENGQSQMPTLSPGIYKYRMAALLRKILIYGTSKGNRRGQYSDIVIDMPPSYDEYSDILLNEIKNLQKENNAIRLNYFSVTTEDMGHLQLTLNNVHEVKRKHSKEKGYDTVNVIFNSTVPDDFSAASWTSNKTVRDIWNELDGDDRIYRKRFDAGYYKYCRREDYSVIVLDEPIEDISSRLERD